MTVLDGTQQFDIASRLARLTFLKCSGCGEKGTWGVEGGILCPDCKEAARGDITKRDRLTGWQHTLAEMEVPTSYRNVPADMAIHADFSFWRGDPWCLTLWGPTGTGKTWLAVRLMGELYVQTDRRGLFVDALAAVQQVRQLREQWAESSYVDDLCQATVLLLDDLSSVRLVPQDATSRTALHLIAHVLRQRASWNRTTIVTSNVALEEWGKQEPQTLDPLVSRMSAALVRQLGGKDRRIW